MRTNLNFAIRVLRGIELLPLEEISEHSEAWRMDIKKAIKELDNRPRLAENDPLLFDKHGVRLSEEVLQKKLDWIISSWRIRK
jgi:protein tyrosine/serine phosphatase